VVELGKVLYYGIIALIQANKPFKLHLEDIVRYVMLYERLFKFCPSNETTFTLNCYEVCPPSTSWASQLLSSEKGLLSFFAMDQSKFLLHHAEPLICFQGFFCFNEDSGKSFREFHTGSVSGSLILSPTSLLVNLISCHLLEESSIISGGI
jgi:hypothetical protein